MDPNDPVVVGLATALVMAGVGGVLALIAAAGRSARTKVADGIRPFAARLGLEVEEGGSFRWWVTARGSAHGRVLELRWAKRGEYVQQLSTQVSVEIPALPVDFALEVFAPGTKPTTPQYAVRSGEPSFDACFEGWTDRTALAPHLLDPAVRAALLGLRGCSGIQLSALTGKWTRPSSSREVRVSIEGARTDLGTLNGLMTAATAFASAATNALGGAHPPPG